MSGRNFRTSFKTFLKLQRHEMRRAEQALVDARCARRKQHKHVETARRRLRTTSERGPVRQKARRDVRAELTRLGKRQQQEAKRRAAVREQRRAEDDLRNALRQKTQAAFSKLTSGSLWPQLEVSC